MVRRRTTLVGAALLAVSLVACRTERTTDTPPVATAPVTGRVPLPGTWLHYQVEGSGPPIVFIEGGNLPLAMWDDQASALRSRYTVIRYDTRGFGASGPYAGPFEQHEDLRTLLDSLGVEQAHLVGLSLGGRIAVDFALQHPQRVTSLALAATGLSGFKGSPGDTSFVMPIWRAIRARDSIGAADAFLRVPSIAPVMEDSLRAARVRALAHANASHWIHPDSERVMTPPAMARLGELRAPTLVMVGTRDHPDILRVADTLMARVPGALRVNFDGAGHILNLEQPDKFNRALLQFLGTVGPVGAASGTR